MIGFCGRTHPRCGGLRSIASAVEVRHRGLSISLGSAVTSMGFSKSNLTGSLPRFFAAVPELKRAPFSSSMFGGGLPSAIRAIWLRNVTTLVARFFEFGVVITAGAACQPWLPGTGSSNVGLLDPRSRSWFALFRVLSDVNSIVRDVYRGTLCCFFEETPLQSASVDYASHLYRKLFPLKTVSCDSGELGLVSRRRWWSTNMVVDPPRLRSWRWSWHVLLPDGWQLRYQDCKTPPLSCIRCWWHNGWSLPAYRPCALMWRCSTSQPEAEQLLADAGFPICELLAVPPKMYESSLLTRFKEFVDSVGPISSVACVMMLGT